MESRVNTAKPSVIRVALSILGSGLLFVLIGPIIGCYLLTWSVALMRDGVDAINHFQLPLVIPSLMLFFAYGIGAVPAFLTGVLYAAFLRFFGVQATLGLGYRFMAGCLFGGLSSLAFEVAVGVVRHNPARLIAMLPLCGVGTLAGGIIAAVLGWFAIARPLEE